MEIVICMGSSCYSRGNARLIEEIEDLIAGIPDITLSGKLCMNQCASGPHLIIDGVCYKGGDPDHIISMLQVKLGELK